MYACLSTNSTMGPTNPKPPTILVSPKLVETIMLLIFISGGCSPEKGNPYCSLLVKEGGDREAENREELTEEVIPGLSDTSNSKRQMSIMPS